MNCATFVATALIVSLGVAHVADAADLSKEMRKYYGSEAIRELRISDRWNSAGASSVRLRPFARDNVVATLAKVLMQKGPVLMVAQPDTLIVAPPFVAKISEDGSHEVHINLMDDVVISKSGRPRISAEDRRLLLDELKNQLRTQYAIAVSDNGKRHWPYLND